MDNSSTTSGEREPGVDFLTDSDRTTLDAVDTALRHIADAYENGDLGAFGQHQDSVLGQADALRRDQAELFFSHLTTEIEYAGTTFATNAPQEGRRDAPDAEGELVRERELRIGTPANGEVIFCIERFNSPLGNRRAFFKGARAVLGACAHMPPRWPAARIVAVQEEHMNDMCRFGERLGEFCANLPPENPVETKLSAQ